MDGLFKLWFESAKAAGVSVCMFKNGRIAGGGTLMYYTGHYEQTGMHFHGEVHARRHAPHSPPLFGLEEFTFSFDGLIYGNHAQFTGYVHEVPGLELQGCLTRLAPLEAPHSERTLGVARRSGKRSASAQTSASMRSGLAPLPS